MSKLKVTFDSDASAKAFADKWKLSTPAGDSLDLEWHLAEDAIKDSTATSHEQKDEDEHEFIVKGDKAAIDALDGSTVEEDLGNGFFRVKSTKGVELGKAVDGIDISDTPVTFLGTSNVSGMTVEETDIDPTSEEGQWARIRVASTYRPLASTYSMHDSNYVTRPELYIMDTGIDMEHPEFQGEDLQIADFWCTPGIWVGGDQIGHGTSVASMAVGTNLGISDNVQLKIVKIAGNKVDDAGNLIDPGVGKQASILELGQALDAIEAEVVKNPNVTRIINVSWGVARSAYLDAKFQSLMSAGVTVVAAAGNSGISVEKVTPAGIDDCLTIGATDKYDIPAGFNNISPSDEGTTTAAGLSLDLFAPGESIMVAHTAGSTHKYGITSGTSFAAPLVAGICGVVGSMTDAIVSANDMKETIMTTATPNALLFEDTTFSEAQNRLAHVFTADPNANYKDAGMVSYLGVVNNRDGDELVVDLNSNLNFANWLKLYPEDKPVFSIDFVDPKIGEIYGEYIKVDSATGIVTIETAKGVILPADTKLEMVEFIGKGITSKTTITSNTIFYFHSNSWSDEDSLDTLQEDVTLALADVNSISFFAYWARSLK
jgi:hypothetical protein|tara:strand:+ start:2805 stop:4607 length:1803 start_codon:yes stop_codon:yes gene_type:complete